jgi:uncharacterized protein YbaA (DUF1428 family)
MAAWKARAIGWRDAISRVVRASRRRCEWPSKEVRDAAMKKMQEDPDMAEGMKKGNQPFSMQRMVFGGFRPVVDERRSK